MTAWLDALTALDRAAEPAVLITVLTARGSTPREAGSKMVVTARGQFDTIGGGNLEYTCIETARRLLTSGAQAPESREFPLGPALGQCCGGHVSVLFEPLRPPDRHVAIFGAGHVGRALTALLSGLTMRVTWLDDRPDTLGGGPPRVRTGPVGDPAETVAMLPAGTLVLVMTHDHQLDFDIVAAALARPDLAAVGVIGSETKRVRFIRRLARLGLPTAAIAGLICPIGIPGAGGKRPEEIAIAVAAQVLQIFHNPRQSAPASDCGTCAAACARQEVLS